MQTNQLILLTNKRIVLKFYINIRNKRSNRTIYEIFNINFYFQYKFFYFWWCFEMWYIRSFNLIKFYIFLTLEQSHQNNILDFLF